MTSPVARYPVNVDLEGRRALVVGGGPIALRKVQGLLAAGARVTVVAPEAVAGIATHDRIRWHRRAYRRGEVASYRVAVTATGRPEVDGQVYRDGEAAGVLVNAADDPEHCSFTLPAIVRRGSVTVAVSTDGRSPALAAWLRRRLEGEAELWAGLAEVAGDVRGELRATRGTSEHDGWPAALEEAAAVLRRHLGVGDARPGPGAG